MLCLWLIVHVCVQHAYDLCVYVLVRCMYAATWCTHVGSHKLNWTWSSSWLLKWSSLYSLQMPLQMLIAYIMQYMRIQNTQHFSHTMHYYIPRCIILQSSLYIVYRWHKRTCINCTNYEQLSRTIWSTIMQCTFSIHIHGMTLFPHINISSHTLLWMNIKML